MEKSQRLQGFTADKTAKYLGSLMQLLGSRAFTATDLLSKHGRADGAVHAVELAGRVQEAGSIRKSGAAVSLLVADANSLRAITAIDFRKRPDGDLVPDLRGQREATVLASEIK